MAIIKPNNNTISAITALPAAIPTGKVLQIISASQTNTVTSTSTSYADISGLSVSITPSSSSNKLFIVYDVMCSNSETSRNDSFQIVRDSTAIISPSNYWRLDDTTSMSQLSGNFLDSPSTTSAVTVKAQWRAESGTITLNRRGDNGTVRSVSSISVMEISA